MRTSGDAVFIDHPVSGERAQQGFNVTRIFRTGTIDAGFALRTTSFYTARSHFLNDGSELLVGEFTAVNGVPFTGNRLILLDVNGRLKPGWNPPEVPKGERYILEQPGGKRVVLGERGATNFWIRYNADGSIDPSFRPSGPAPAAHVVTVDAEGAFYAFSFPDESGKIVRYSSEGELDPTFRAATTGHIRSLHPAPDGSVVVLEVPVAADAGAYVRLRHDGSADETFHLPQRLVAESGDGVTMLPDSSFLVTSATYKRSHVSAAGVIDYEIKTAELVDSTKRVKEVGSILFRYLRELGGAAVATRVWHWDLDVSTLWISSDGRLRTRWSNGISVHALRRAAPAGDKQPMAQVVNVSTRLYAGGPAGTPIAGIVVDGNLPTPLLVRAVGPTLRDFGLTSVLATPQVKGPGSTPTWEGWRVEQASSMRSTGAFPLRAGSQDAARFLSLTSGLYTAQVEDAGAGEGVVLIEVYDRTPWLGMDRRLLNVSTRGFVGDGDRVMAGGFVVRGPGAVNVLIRAVGPSLARYGVGGALEDPQIELFRGAEKLQENDNWGTRTDGVSVTTLAQLAKGVGAFELDVASKDAAIVRTVSEGAYTVVVRGRPGATGTALFELYVIDEK